MSNIYDLIKSNLSDEVVGQLASRLGARPEQTQTATKSAIQLMLAALNKNARSEEGARSLANALENDHDGGILDNLMDFVGGSANVNSRTANGEGILGHLLGDKMGGAFDMISKMSGLNSNQSGSLMKMLAPIVMGSLGRSARQNNSGFGGLTDLLGAAISGNQQRQEQHSMLERFLDQDGDGSVVDDLLSMGMKFLRK